MITASGELILGSRFFMGMSQPPGTNWVTRKHTLGD